jgi:hypothetical protein
VLRQVLLPADKRRAVREAPSSRLEGRQRPGGGTDEGAQRGHTIKAVPTVQERTAASLAEIDKRYKPLIAAAESQLTDVKAEMAAAKAQLEYSRATYFGPGARQIYKDEYRVVSIQPRLDQAQAKFDTLNAQKQAEVQALEATAREPYDSEKKASDKAFAAGSVTLPASKVAVELATGSSKDKRTFTVVRKDGAWRLYDAK